jgi:hypothetical protein
VAMDGPVKSNTPGHVARFGGYEPVFVFNAWSGGRCGEASYSLSILCRARDFHVRSVGSLFSFSFFLVTVSDDACETERRCVWWEG